MDAEAWSDERIRLIVRMQRHYEHVTGDLQDERLGRKRPEFADPKGYLRRMAAGASKEAA